MHHYCSYFLFLQHTHNIHKQDAACTHPTTKILYSWNAREWKHNYFSHSNKNFRNFEVIIPVYLQNNTTGNAEKIESGALRHAYLERYIGMLRLVMIGKITSYYQEQGWHRYVYPLYSLINTHLLMNINNKIPQLRENRNKWQFKYCICKLLYADSRLHSRIMRN